MRATTRQILDGIKAREKDYATMKPYSGNSGPLSRCVKCGGKEALTSLKKKSMFGFIESGNNWELFNDTAYEVMERKCPKCGYIWEEIPLDVYCSKDNMPLCGHAGCKAKAEVHICGEHYDGILTIQSAKKDH